MPENRLIETAREGYALQDYSSPPSIEGVRKIAFRRFVDDGGSFFEMGRLSETAELQALPGFQVRQISFSEMLPGTIKAFHLHLEQDDLWFVPPGQRLLVGLCDVRSDSPTANTAMRLVLGDGQTDALFIPHGVAHGCANPWGSPVSVIYFVNRHFSAGSDSDEGRLPWDFVGEDFWTIRKG